MPSCPNVMPGTSPKSPFFTCKSGGTPRNTPFQRRFAVLQRAQYFILNVYGMVFRHYGSFHGVFLSSVGSTVVNVVTVFGEGQRRVFCVKQIIKYESV